MYDYRWSIQRSGFGWRCSLYVGSIINGNYRRLLSEWHFRHKNAEKAVLEVLQGHMNRNRVWRVGEGGNSPIANNWSVKPWIIGLITPNGEKAKPYDFWPKSWGPEPTEEEYARESLYR